MASDEALILGCGYTGKRVARELAAKGYRVLATSRTPESLKGLDVRALRVDIDDAQSLAGLRPLVNIATRVLISIPAVNADVMAAIAQARRVVFLSTTGVYGPQREVDERSVPTPATDRERARFASEQVVSSAANSLILRPAAIYGPHRGIHTAMASGTYRLWGGGANFVSRIHADDLAAHCVAALESDVTGSWPVADCEPCTSLEIASFCADLLGLPLPENAPPDELGETRRADRRVDGSGIRRALGISLRYPSYRGGIPACVAAESAPVRAF